ncbi:hypothetical protein BKA82DRAFT_4256155 [Pisolithus tinctorius]|nr:hypothetical protein BKA82DRAFT_4256155 [Pisolithus tinctorius]
MRTTTTRLDAERKPCEARTAVQWKREAINTDPELESSKFHFDFRRFYLHLCCSMEYEVLQGIDEASCYETSTKDVDLVVGGSSSVGRHIVEHLARGDTISELDIVQRHRGVSSCMGDITDERDVLGVSKESSATYDSAKDSSVHCEVNVEGTRTIIVATIAAGASYHHSQTRIQISDNNNLFDYAYVGNVAQACLQTADGLVPPPSYSSTTPSEPKLNPESSSATLDESLHRALPPVCTTTEYHHLPYSSAQPLSPHVAPPPNAESILSAFNTSFDPPELKHPTIRSRVDVRRELRWTQCPLKPPDESQGFVQQTQRYPDISRDLHMTLLRFGANRRCLEARGASQ